MRCLIDTNILISAALFPNSVPAKAFIKAVSSPYSALVSDYSFEEMRTVFLRKFPTKLDVLEQFIVSLSVSLEYVKTPSVALEESLQGEQLIRDIDDRPIYRAAIFAKADIILTGDKDLLDSGILQPRIITASDFINNY